MKTSSSHARELFCDIAWERARNRRRCEKLGTSHSKQLVRPSENRLLNALQLYNYGREQISSVKVFYIPIEKVLKAAGNLAPRFGSAKKVPG